MVKEMKTILMLAISDFGEPIVMFNANSQKMDALERHQNCYKVLQDTGFDVRYATFGELKTNKYPRKTVLIWPLFNGEVEFERLVADRHYRIYSTSYVQLCLDINVSLKCADHPLAGETFSGLHFSFTNIDEVRLDQLKTRIEYLMGICHRDLSTLVEYLICDEVGGPKYERARSNNITILRAAFIDEVYKRSMSEHPLRSIDEAVELVKCHKSLPFDGLSISLTGFTLEERNIYSTLIQDKGGQCDGKLDLNKTTHLVADSCNTDKIKCALQHNRIMLQTMENSSNKKTNERRRQVLIKIVTKDWLVDCVKQEGWIKEDQYLLTGDESDEVSIVENQKQASTPNDNLFNTNNIQVEPLNLTYTVQASAGTSNNAMPTNNVTESMSPNKNVIANKIFSKCAFYLHGTVEEGFLDIGEISTIFDESPITPNELVCAKVRYMVTSEMRSQNTHATFIDDLSEAKKFETYDDIRQIYVIVANFHHSSDSFDSLLDEIERLDIAKPVEIVTLPYFFACMNRKQHLSPCGNALFRPLLLADGASTILRNENVYVSGYILQLRACLKILVTLLGGRFEEIMCRTNKYGNATTLLVSTANSKKYNAARKWGIKIVSHSYFVEAAITGKMPSVSDHMLLENKDVFYNDRTLNYRRDDHMWLRSSVSFAKALRIDRPLTQTAECSAMSPRLFSHSTIKHAKSSTARISQMNQDMETLNLASSTSQLTEEIGAENNNSSRNMNNVLTDHRINEALPSFAQLSLKSSTYDIDGKRKRLHSSNRKGDFILFDTYNLENKKTPTEITTTFNQNAVQSDKEPLEDEYSELCKSFADLQGEYSDKIENIAPDKTYLEGKHETELNSKNAEIVAYKQEMHGTAYHAAGQILAPLYTDYDEEEDDGPGEQNDIQQVTKVNNILPLWGDRITMNMNGLPLTYVQQSPYFNKQLSSMKHVSQVFEEIYSNVTHLEPWERGTRQIVGLTGMCEGVRGVGSGGVISTAFCTLYRLFVMRLNRRQLVQMINFRPSPYIRGIGFMYIRFCQPPEDLWRWFEPYLDDEDTIDPKSGGGEIMTFAQMVRQMLTKLDWYNTFWPRIPNPFQKQIQESLKNYDALRVKAVKLEPEKVEPRRPRRNVPLVCYKEPSLRGKVLPTTSK